MILTFIAVLCSGLFAGAAIYINAVEHPARLATGTANALAQWHPSYRRATVMQVTLAALGTGAAVVGWARGHGTALLVGGLLLVAVVPVSLIVIFPTNRRLENPRLDPTSAEAAHLLVRWGYLHAIRAALGLAAFLVMCAAAVGVF